MKKITIIKYETSDGTLFDTKSEAEKYENDKTRDILKQYSLDKKEFQEITSFIGVSPDELLDFGMDRIYLFDHIYRTLKRVSKGDLAVKPEKIIPVLAACIDIYNSVDHD